MPIRHADTTKIATRFAFTCSNRFNLKDNSDYEKTVDKQSREKITTEKQHKQLIFKFLKLFPGKLLEFRTFEKN